MGHTVSMRMKSPAADYNLYDKEHRITKIADLGLFFLKHVPYKKNYTYLCTRIINNMQ